MAADAPDRHRWPVVLAAAGIVVVAAALTWEAGSDEVHALPPSGATVPVVLDDGWPAFVTHTADGTVRAFDARAPAHADRRRGLLTWCPSSETFVDPLHGFSWHADGSGRVLRGTLPRSHRAADREPPDLHELPTEVAGDRVRLRPEQADRRAAAWPRPSARASCPRDDAVRPPLPGRATSLGDLGDGDARDGVWHVSGRLEETATDRPQLCADGPTGQPCGEEALELAALPATSLLPEGQVQQTAVEAVLVIAEGRVVELLVRDSGPPRVAPASEAARVPDARASPADQRP